MPDSEKSTIQRLADALNVLPETKQEYLLGYADGANAVAAAAQQPEQKPE